MRQGTPPKKASQGDWHPADIKAALEKAGWTLRKLAAHHGVAPTGVKYALRGRHKPAEKRIADALGIHPMVIWPSRYEPDGSRRYLPRGRHVKRLHSSAATAAVNGKDGGVK